MNFLLTTLISVYMGLSIANEWGQTGHRTVGLVAEQYLTKKARKAIDKLLEGESLAYVSNYGDDIKSDDRYNDFYSWHYINLPADRRYGEEEPNPKGDVYTAINRCIAVLRDQNSSVEDRQFYLKLLVHFIGDLHQPMHVGRPEDRGGNDVSLTWFGKKTNLHRIWDSDMIDSYQLSYSELAQNLPKLSKQEITKIQNQPIIEWVHESQDLANTLYDDLPEGRSKEYRYRYRYFDTARMQLLKGGLRLAAVLNQIFK